MGLFPESVRNIVVRRYLIAQIFGKVAMFLRQQALGNIHLHICFVLPKRAASIRVHGQHI